MVGKGTAQGMIAFALEEERNYLLEYSDADGPRARMILLILSRTKVSVPSVIAYQADA